MKKLIVCAIVALAGCKAKGKVLDATEVQARVAEAAEQLADAVGSAQCPPIPAAAGTTATCDVTFEGGHVMKFTVRQVDGGGTLQIEPQGEWLRGHTMAAELTTELFLLGHHDATVICGGPMVPVTLPAQVECQVHDGARRAKIAVAVDAEGAVDWKIVGEL